MGYICKKRWNTNRDEPDKNTNKELAVENQDSGHTVARNAYDHKGGLWWKSNLSRWTEKFHWLWIF